MKRYDHSAHVYDAQYHEEQQAKIKTALAEIHFSKQDVVIDLGCGTGQLLPHILNSVKLVACVDVSRNMLAQAKTRARHIKHMTLLRADADYLPFQPHKFDMAFAITLLQNMPHPIQTLNEMRRISKEGANLIVTGLKKTFDERQFTCHLEKAGLKVNSLRMDTAQREYIAVCTILKESLNRTPKLL